ncbi:NADH-quinone oxidoreductase subunit NuoF [Leadbettera azotonutricia]|uniref:HndBC n=1 Tax=Leadbettera azotonutricia (strain ATCC BAA-888 / DSM 13862 / ZAS-9) TaxID=545695 RepID=F5Y971_LEAAZ|nr:NADH-quinone oxidoreductase subunit NuoF [Leadbettera azotonutricia]AEF82914.1 NAD-dependent formate dehydrogenase beta subunit [Leadbettera azotonutricia ZAS-9]AEL20842.1 HndBC [Leadbettera azotonutricia ZAS-9]
MAYNHFILTCGGTGCESNKGDEIYKSLIANAEKLGVKNQVQIVKTGCFGFCERGPIVKVLPEDSFYVDVKPEDAAEIIAEQIVKGREVPRLLYKGDAEKKSNTAVEDIEFYQKQVRVVLRNCGVINPENIDEYIAREGYLGLEKVLFQWTPEQTIEEMKVSGLRGRGGAGFPTWMKWDFARKAPGDVKYVICNADEGDPGAYMDRSTIEGDPHSVIEGMITAGKAIGSHQGFVYIRAEYPLAIERLKIAIRQAQEYGLLGKDILGSGFDFDIEIRLGAGAFVCGEETALIKSIEGNRGMPVPKPPFPANKGLWQKPTIINNVETLANVPVITNKGGAWLAKIGTEKSKGTKVFALTGKIKNSGLVEVPMGTTLREIIFEIGGGIKGGKKFKGVQTGGPSGGILTEALLDTPIDFDTLVKNGSMMGSGGMIVMDEDDCVVDVARFYMEFCVDESCGKCSPCRIGTSQLLAILDKIAGGNGTEADLEKLETIGKAMSKASLCALGQTAPNPTLSTVKNFREEYLEHIRDKKCRAGKCKKLVRFEINLDKCIGCGACSKKCPANCITQVEGTDKKRPPYRIDPEKCLKCGECFKACKFGAVAKV